METGFQDIRPKREQVVCPSCGSEDAFQTTILMDSPLPAKILVCIECSDCGKKSVGSHLAQKNDYGVKITCNVTKEVDLRRHVIINEGAAVCVTGPDSLEVTYTIENSGVTLIETFLDKGMEVLKNGKIHELEGIDDQISAMEQAMKGPNAKIVITDPSGYTRVCPLDRDEKTVEGLTFGDLNDESVYHEKI